MRTVEVGFIRKVNIRHKIERSRGRKKVDCYIFMISEESMLKLESKYVALGPASA